MFCDLFLSLVYISCINFKVGCITIFLSLKVVFYKWADSKLGGFVVYTVAITATYLFPCRVKAALDSM